MSYYTNVELSFAWEDQPDHELVLARARTYLEAQGDRDAVEFILEELREALRNDRGDFKGLDSFDFEGLMASISAGFPGLIFYVRG